MSKLMSTNSEDQTRRLRSAFGCFATGIAVVTTTDATGNQAGVTVNSFTSVSLEPPLVSFSLLDRANCLDRFYRADAWVVNILERDQRSLSDNFARPSTSTWQHVVNIPLDNGQTRLQGALAWFCCRPYGSLVVGDHVMFLGKIADFGFQPSGESLGFYRGRYMTVAASHSPSAPSPFELETESVGLGWS